MTVADNLQNEHTEGVGSANYKFLRMCEILNVDADAMQRALDTNHVMAFGLQVSEAMKLNPNMTRKIVTAMLSCVIVGVMSTRNEVERLKEV